MFPGSTHVRDADLQRADDLTIWSFAADGGFSIVTKDDDFRQLSFLRGSPPHVVWVRLGNCTTDEVADLLRRRAQDIAAFAEDDESAIFVLDPRSLGR